jgi:hypothetical protein
MLVGIKSIDWNTESFFLAPFPTIWQSLEEFTVAIEARTAFLFFSIPDLG